MEDNYNIDEQLKGLMQGMEVQPDIRSFDTVIRKLERKEKKRRFIIFLLAAVALLSGVLALIPFAVAERPEKTGNPAAGTLSPSEGGAAMAIAKKDPQKRTGVVASPTLTGSQSRPHIERHTTSGQESGTKPGKQQTRSETQEADQITGTEKNAETAAGQHAINKKEAENGIGQEAVMAGKKQDLKQAPATAPVTTLPEPDPSLTGTVKTEALPATDSLATSLFLPVILTRLAPDTTLVLRSSFDPPALLPAAKKKRNYDLYLGLAFTPQYSSYLFFKNKQRSPHYEESGEGFSDFYLKGRRKQERPRFNYAFGLKLDLVLDDTYELSLGFGLQTYRYNEKLYRYISSQGLAGISNASYNSAADLKSGFRSQFSYYYYSLECSRKQTLNKWTRCYLGLGLRAEQLRYAGYTYANSADVYYSTSTVSGASEYVSRQLYTARFKMGLEQKLGRRFRLKLCPAVFYSLNSMFDKNYVIKQKPIGAEAEVSLMFRIF